MRVPSHSCLESSLSDFSSFVNEKELRVLALKRASTKRKRKEVCTGQKRNALIISPIENLLEINLL